MNAHRQLTISDLSPDQLEAYNAIKTWLNRGTGTKQTLTLGGFAGAGKSALVSVIAHEMPKPLAFAAFTGKAASVLGRKLAASGIATCGRIVRSKNMPVFEPRPYCGTIHGLIYRPCDVCMIEEEFAHTYGAGCQETRPDAGEVVMAGGIQFTVAPPDGPCLACNPPPPVKRGGPCYRCQDTRYLRRETLDRGYRLIVVDEASMVSDEMLDALLSYRVPVLAVGDHGQLPPVRGSGRLMAKPDLRLEKIHRQAEGNPIIALSKRIRETGDIADELEDGNAFTVLSRRELDAWIAKRWTAGRLAADPQSPDGALGTVLVSWTNRLRVNLTEAVRNAMGIEGSPKKGEALICLKNAAPIYNGMRGVLEADAVRAGSDRAPRWKGTVNFVEDGQTASNVEMSEHQFFAEKTIDYDRARELGVSYKSLGGLYDFGYALTCHKMQGSQSAEVGVVIEGGLFKLGRDERTRWIYTSCTRAESNLTIFRG